MCQIKPGRDRETRNKKQEMRKETRNKRQEARAEIPTEDWGIHPNLQTSFIQTSKPSSPPG